MIAASVVLYVGLGIILAITVWNHCKATQRKDSFPHQARQARR
jgi:hypothetical protein